MSHRFAIYITVVLGFGWVSGRSGHASILPGYVYGSPGCQPLSDMTVALTPPRSTHSGQLVTKTDQGGKFALNYPQKGSVYLEIRQGDAQIYARVIDLEKEQMPLLITLTRAGAPKSPCFSTGDTSPSGPNAIFNQGCGSPSFPSQEPVPIDRICGPAGAGGILASENIIKNNFCTSAPAHPIAIGDMVKLQERVQSDPGIPFGNRFSHPLTNRAGPAPARSELAALGEGREVSLVGFVKFARQERKESVNCESQVPDLPEFHDIHISIVQSPDDSECSAVIVEMSPHHRPASWTASNVNRLADRATDSPTALPPRVRVTGQLFFDSAHTPCLQGHAVRGDPSRASLWEIHPIYSFEVCVRECEGAGQWISLDQWIQVAASP